MFRETCSPLHQDEEQASLSCSSRPFFLYYATCWRSGGKRRIEDSGGGGEGGDGENWLVFSNRENDVQYFIYINHYLYLDY